MAVKKTGISRDFIIHPGETIADVLEERGISQTELAFRTGVSPAYVSNVLAGKKKRNICEFCNGPGVRFGCSEIFLVKSPGKL